MITTSILLLLSLTASASGVTHFIRPGASGDGSSWSSAWGNVSNVQWNRIGAGDSICIAGGTYSGSLTTGVNGNSNLPVVLKRAIGSDASCGSKTAGWDDKFDAQVVMTGTITLKNDYIQIDGMIPNGISLIMQNPSSNAYVAIGTGAPTKGIVLRNIEVAGPCNSTSTCLQANDHRSLQMEYWNGSAWATHADWLIQSVNLHGACNNMVIYGATNLIVEHSRFADSGTTNSANCHPNIVNAGANTSVTWRYNEMVNWQVEGIMLLGGNGQWDIYGNLWHDPQRISYPRVIESQDSVNGPVLLYNNTFVNLFYLTATTSNGGSYKSGSQGRNNIYWNTNVTPSGLPSDDYDYSDKPLSNEAHGQGSAKNPFVDLADSDYHLAFDTLPGLALSSPYGIDYDGLGRGLTGIWDRGAYQYQGQGSNATPMAPTGLTAVVH